MIIYLAGYGHPMAKTKFFKQVKPNILLTFYDILEHRLQVIKQGKAFLAQQKEKRHESLRHTTNPRRS